MSAERKLLSNCDHYSLAYLEIKYWKNLNLINVYILFRRLKKTFIYISHELFFVGFYLYNMRV